MVAAEINNLHYFLVHFPETNDGKYKISIPVPEYSQKNTFNADEIPDWVQHKITLLCFMEYRNKMTCGSFRTEYGCYIFNDNIK